MTTERKYIKRLPAPAGYCTVAQWNVSTIVAQYHPAHGYVGVKLGDTKANALPDAELSLTPAGWRAVMTAVLAVMPTGADQPLTRDDLLMAANIIDRLYAFPALNNRRGEWSADMLRHEAEFFEGGSKYTTDDSDYPAAEVTA